MTKRRPARVRVCGGNDWDLFWPVEKWARLTEAQRADIIATQTALLQRYDDCDITIE